MSLKRRFSLRCLFVVLTVFCIWFGTVVRNADRQRRAVRWIREIGGSALYTYELGKLTRFPRPKTEPAAPPWLRELIGVDFFERIERVHLIGEPARDFSPLALFRHVKKLTLDGSEISDLRPLSNLTRVETLSLTETLITDLAPLRRLKRLTELNLTSTHVSDVTPLARLHNLRSLNLRFTDVADVQPLTRLTNLQQLDLTHTLVREEDYQTLRSALPHCQIDWDAYRLNRLE